MNVTAASVLLGSQLFLLVPNVSAQFYAPDTEFHDPAQRFFVVETARVLAWRAGAESKITEVKFDVITKPDHSTSWNLRWINARGDNVKTLTVSYPDTLLKEGPRFYRKVFKDIWTVGWRGTAPIKPAQAMEAYWAGAEKMGWSREEGALRGFELIKSAGGEPDGVQAAELAGLMSHLALPGMSGRLTIDSHVLARAAAWLMIAEQSTAADIDALWPPLLFQVGREKAARDLWQRFNPGIAEKNVCRAGWSIWLKKPRSTDVYAFAASTNNLTLGLPMLAYDARVNGTRDLFAELLPDIIGAPAALPRVSNYMPDISIFGTVGGGHILNGFAPAIDRANWLTVLSRYPSSSELAPYQATIRSSLEAMRLALTRKGELPDTSLTGFKESVPLLRLGWEHGAGPLIPTGLFTVRDWLNYGWEMTGHHMGSRYSFIRKKLGLREDAEAIKREVTENLQGLMPFFSAAQTAATHNFGEALLRLQLVDGFSHRWGFSPNPFSATGDKNTAAILFMRRSWSRPSEFDWQARTFSDAQMPASIPGLMEIYREEDNHDGMASVLKYFLSIGTENTKKLPRAEEFQRQFLDALPQKGALYMRLVFLPATTVKNNFQRAQVDERFYWENPENRLEDRIIFNYLVSGAHKSAKRFYLQCRPQLSDPVRFSNMLGALIWNAGFVLQDPDLRRMALEDSQSDSHADLVLNVMDAAANDNDSLLKEKVNELVEHYESDKGADAMGHRLQGFLPLLPALKNPKHPAHEKALRYFGRHEGWVVLRWIWITRFKISTEEAVTFLGGRENDLMRQALISCLEKNQPTMLDALNKIIAENKLDRSQRAFVALLYDSLRKYVYPGEQPDLKPKGVRFIREIVAEKKAMAPRR